MNLNKDLNKDQIAPRIELPNVIKHHAIPSTTVIATRHVQEAVERLRELKRQETTLKKLIEAEEKTIKEYMGDSIQLLDMAGNEAVTWKYDADREELDKKALKLNFADVYYACVEIVKGSRKFLIKR